MDKSIALFLFSVYPFYHFPFVSFCRLIAPIPYILFSHAKYTNYRQFHTSFFTHLVLAS